MDLKAYISQEHEFRIILFVKTVAVFTYNLVSVII